MEREAERCYLQLPPREPHQARRSGEAPGRRATRRMEAKGPSTRDDAVRREVAAKRTGCGEGKVRAWSARWHCGDFRSKFRGIFGFFFSLIICTF